MRTITRLNEEIARWTFEIQIKENKSWMISFTNPTAGPWKIIKAKSLEDGEEGEVYRFPLKEERPDIIMYNDKLKSVLIIEAKDNIDKLFNVAQARKSANVVLDLAEKLSDNNDNKFWSGRQGYKMVLGLLWGSNNISEEETKRNRLFDLYHDLINGNKTVYSDLIIGIESLYKDKNINCSAFYKEYSDEKSGLGAKLVSSLELNSSK